MRADLERLTQLRRSLVLENKKLGEELDERNKTIVVLKQKLAKAGVIVADK